MGRKSSFTEGQVFGAVAEVLRDGGALTIQGIAARAGLSTGSLYHRFASREVLLAECWLDAIEAFQAQFRQAMAHSGREAALATPRFCRAESARALVLEAVRPDPAVALPAPLRARVMGVNDGIAEVLAEHARANGRPVELARFALIDMPLAAVRPYLHSQTLPQAVEVWVAAAYDAVLARPVRAPA